MQWIVILISLGREWWEEGMEQFSMAKSRCVTPQRTDTMKICLHRGSGLMPKMMKEKQEKRR